MRFSNESSDVVVPDDELCLPPTRFGDTLSWMFRTVEKPKRVLHAFVAIILFVATNLSASEIEYLKKSESFCDTSGKICLSGTISYRVNTRVLQLRARLVKATGPGRLLIGVTGVNRLGYPRRADIEVDIRGNYSEIVRTEMIPDAPDVYSWQLENIRFVAKK